MAQTPKKIPLGAPSPHRSLRAFGVWGFLLRAFFGVWTFGI
jgi:hypothetical protein